MKEGGTQEPPIQRGMERPGLLCWVLAGSNLHTPSAGAGEGFSSGIFAPRCGGLRSALQERRRQHAVGAPLQLAETSQPVFAAQVKALEGE